MNLILQANTIGCIAYIIDNNGLISFQYKFNNTPNLYDIYYGKIIEKNISLSSYLVELSKEHNALLDFSSSNNNLVIGSKLLVQVVKEATLPNKMAKVTNNIALIDCLVTYKPYAKPFVNNKLLNNNEPFDQFNNIAINVSYGYNASLFSYLQQQVLKLQNLFNYIKQTNNIGLVLSYNLAILILNKYGNNIKNIYIDNSLYGKEISNYISNNKYLEVNVVAINKQIIETLKVFINEAKNNNIIYNNDVNLSIYSTSSFNYIDVNFNGNYVVNSKKEETVYHINTVIMPTIIQHINSKNLSGQILIDLLKTKNNHHKKQLLNLCKKLIKNNFIKMDILGFSNLGLLEMTRQKHQENLDVLLNSVNYNAWQIMEIINNTTNSNLTINVNSAILNFINKYAHTEIKQLNKHIKFNINNNILFSVSEN